ncbi:MAG: amidohydrolase family protein, partial [Acidimicrobiia bacterium]
MALAAGGSPRVDLHSHVIAPSLPDLERNHPFGRWPTLERDGDRGSILVGGRHFREVDNRCWSAERRVVDLDADGVDVQVVSPVPVTLCHDAPAAGAILLAAAQNDFLADFVAGAPDRLVALGAVPLQEPEAAVAELERCVGELGFSGVEIGTVAGEWELSDAALDPFFVAAERLGALVFVHPATLPGGARLAPLDLAFGVGMPCETAVAAAHLLAGGVLGAHPGVRICLAHGGGALPMILPRIDRGWQLQSERLRRSSVPPSSFARSLYADSLTYDPASLALAVSCFGANRIMLGTDYPFAARETPPGAVLEAGLARGLLDEE